MSTYTQADKTTQWFANAYPGAAMTPNCGVLHTTETTGWPGYEAGATAPTYTARPDFTAKRLRFRAHFPDEMSARALVNAPGGVDTNTANVVQLELVGTCDPTHAVSWRVGTKVLRAGIDYVYWPSAPEWALLDVARFILDQHKRHGTPLAGVATWKPYPSSYGSTNGVRLSFAQWRAFKGWCGHQHVPENLHGDPGNLPFARILQLALQLLNPTPAATKELDMHKLVRLKDQPAVWLSNGIQRRHVPSPAALDEVQAWLKSRGLPTTVVVVSSLDAYGAPVEG